MRLEKELECAKIILMQKKVFELYNDYLETTQQIAIPTFMDKDLVKYIDEYIARLIKSKRLEETLLSVL